MKCLYKNKFIPHLNKFEIACYDNVTGLEIDCSECESCKDFDRFCYQLDGKQYVRHLPSCEGCGEEYCTDSFGTIVECPSFNEVCDYSGTLEFFGAFQLDALIDNNGNVLVSGPFTTYGAALNALTGWITSNGYTYSSASIQNPGAPITPGLAIQVEVLGTDAPILNYGWSYGGGLSTETIDTQTNCTVSEVEECSSPKTECCIEDGIVDEQFEISNLLDLSTETNIVEGECPITAKLEINNDSSLLTTVEASNIVFNGDGAANIKFTFNKPVKLQVELWSIPENNGFQEVTPTTSIINGINVGGVYHNNNQARGNSIFVIYDNLTGVEFNYQSPANDIGFIAFQVLEYPNCILEEQLAVHDKCSAAILERIEDSLDTDCGDFTGNCMCFESQDGDSIQSTGGGFSMNLTSLKYSNPSTTAFIDDCINSGEIANISILDTNGNTVIFAADTIVSSGAFYTGTGSGGFSGEIDTVTVTCGEATLASKACQWMSCDKETVKWFSNGVELTEEEIDSLVECIIPTDIEPCETEITQFQGCATEDTVDASIDDLILTVAKKDCNGVIISSTQYNITQGNVELTEPVNTTSCSPEPDVTQTEECIIDTNGEIWTEITIVQDTTITVIYVNQKTLTLGTPSGTSDEWKSCSDVLKYPKDVCYISPESTNGIVGKRWDSELNAAPFDTNTNTFPEWDTHINGAADEEVIITNNWSLNDLDFPVTGAYEPANGDRDISSQELFYAWLNVKDTIKLRDTNGNTGEYISIFLEDCNKDMVQVVKDKYTTGADRNAGEFTTLCPGIHKIAIQINDYSVFGGFLLQYSSDDGATWAAFPMADTYSTPPKTITTCVLYGEDGSITNIDGTPFTEEIIPCNPPCYPMTREVLPDTEVSIVDGCDDIDGDPANYVNVTREVIFVGSQSTTTYYTNYGDENLQAEYTIVGGFVDCATGEPIEEPVVPPPCENWSTISVYKPVGTNGVNVERWVTNAITGLPTNTTVPSDVFNGAVDYSGMPSHDNGVPDGPIVVESDLTILDQNNGQDQFRYWTYLYTPEPVRIREFFPRAEAVDYFLGECGNTPTKVATGVYPNTTAIVFDVSLDAGIHYIGGEVFDATAYSGVRYQYSKDNGVTWANVPASWLYTSKPTISECPAKVCIETGVCADLKTGLALGDEVTLCKPDLCSGSADPIVVQCAPQTFYKVNVGTIGTVEQKWTTSAISTTTATGHSYKDAFTGTGSDGLPSHPNAADTTISATTATTTNVLQGDSPVIDDQAQSDFWIYLPTDANLQEFNATAEAVGVWISEKCGGPLQEVLDGTYLNSTANPLGFYSAGWYQVRLYHHDVTANGIARLQADFGNGFVNIPAYLEAPTVEVIKGWYCSDGNDYNQDRSQVLDDTWLCEDPRCKTSNCLTC